MLLCGRADKVAGFAASHKRKRDGEDRRDEEESKHRHLGDEGRSQKKPRIFGEFSKKHDQKLVLSDALVLHS